MNWAEWHIQQIETPKTKAKEYIEWGLKVTVYGDRYNCGFFCFDVSGF